MKDLTTVTARGSLTLPKELRKKAGILDGGPVQVIYTEEGILIRPVSAFPLEIYTKERIAEFDKMESELGNLKIPVQK